jgi:ORF6N domain
MSLFEREFGLFRLTNSRESSQGMPSLNSPGGQGRCPRQRGSRLQQPLPRSPQSEGGSIINSQEDTVSFIDQLRIFEVRDHAVVLDRDLATIYGVVTKQFNRAVRRNTTGFRRTLRPMRNLRTRGSRLAPQVRTADVGIVRGRLQNTMASWPRPEWRQRYRHQPFQPMSRSPINQSLILFVGPDPKPLGDISLHHGERTKIAAHPGRPKVSNPLKIKRWMARFAQPQLEILSGKPANLRRNVPKSFTKARVRRGLHQVEPLADRSRLPLGGCKALGVFRCARPLRSAGPTLLTRAPSIGAITRETLLAGASRWLLRFPRVCSSLSECFNRTAIARSAAPLSWAKHHAVRNRLAPRSASVRRSSIVNT